MSDLSVTVQTASGWWAYVASNVSLFGGIPEQMMEDYNDKCGNQGIQEAVHTDAAYQGIRQHNCPGIDNKAEEAEGNEVKWQS